jgi:DNA (cytosine-5)-methyltransferase 1
MNVLSLFDGMSGGMIALEKAGVKVDNYFASEVDKYAMQVSKANYPNIKQIGSIVDVDAPTLPKIDLLIGGSSCQDFSLAGKRAGMSTEDNTKIVTLEHYLELKDQGVKFKGQSYLFWEYVRLLRELKPKYFFLENVRMKKEWEDVITEALGVAPVMINSRLVSAQNRVRYYWTNIPNITQPEDKGIVLNDILENEVDEKYFAGKVLQENYAGGNQLNPKYKSQANTIHTGEKSGTICAGTHGYTNGYVAHAICGASRGRYIVEGKRQDGKMLTAGKTEQMMEVRPDNKTNCLTTVGKDNLVTYGLKHGDRIPLKDCKLIIPEATKKGFIEVKDGECFDYAIPNSKTRRGRSMKEKANALLTSNGFMRYEHPYFRKFTPEECEALQTVPRGYTASVSDSQRYKMLGNGWTIDVITHIFKNLK